MPDEPDDEPPLRLRSLQRAAAARRQHRRALGAPGASAQAEYQRRRQGESATWVRTCGSPLHRPLARRQDPTDATTTAAEVVDMFRTARRAPTGA